MASRVPPSRGAPARPRVCVRLCRDASRVNQVNQKLSFDRTDKHCIKERVTMQATPQDNTGGNPNDRDAAENTHVHPGQEHNRVMANSCFLLKRDT